MENNTFSYNYSAVRNREVESIRRRYLPKEDSKLESLKRLDLRVQTAGMAQSLCLGIVGALIFGLGMCLLLEVLPGAVWLAAVMMLLGAVIMILAYPIYRYISNKIRNELAPQILSLSEEILKN